MRYFAVALHVVLLGSCADLKKSEQIERIDSMSQALDSIQKAYDAEKIDTIVQWGLTMYEVEKHIKQYYVADTIDMELGRKMDAYKITRRELNSLAKSMNAVRSGLMEETQKLTDLRKDIENGNGKREKYDEYLAFEEEKVNQIRSLMEDYISIKERSQKTFDELHGELFAFSEKLMHKDTK